MPTKRYMDKDNMIHSKTFPAVNKNAETVQNMKRIGDHHVNLILDFSWQSGHESVRV